MAVEETSRRKQNRDRSTVAFDGPGKVRQSETDDSDINKIMGKYRSTGIWEHVNLNRPVYADFTNATDYMTARNILNQADQLFASLPARVRQYCDNDPAKLIELVDNPENETLLKDLGLINPVEPRQEPEEKPPEVTPGEE